MRPSVVAAVLAAARLAAAAPPGETEPRQAMPPPAAGEEEKSPALAVTLSLLGTLAPIAIVSAGMNSSSDDARADAALLGALTLVLAPTAGHWYAGRAWTTATTVRLVGVGIATAGVYTAITSDGEGGAGAGLMICGLIAAAGGAIYDISTAGDAVDRWNHAHAIRMQPTALRMHGGGYGVGLAGSF